MMKKERGCNTNTSFDVLHKYTLTSFAFTSFFLYDTSHLGVLMEGENDWGIAQKI